jgi:hypothetical protein
MVEDYYAQGIRSRLPFHENGAARGNPRAPYLRRGVSIQTRACPAAQRKSKGRSSARGRAHPSRCRGDRDWILRGETPDANLFLCGTG